MRVTAREQKNEKGLARIGQAPRGFKISVDGKEVGHVGWSSNLFAAKGEDRGSWFWYAGFDVGNDERVSRNSAAHGVFFKTREDSRDACMEWIKCNWRTEKKA